MSLVHASNLYPQVSVINHLSALVKRKSITPVDAGCQQYLTQELQTLGFQCKSITIQGVSNLIASIGEGDIRIAFAGHTDVVPPGDSALWQHNPFEGSVHQGKFYGRGVADMKGGIAAMLSAFSRAKSLLDFVKFKFYFLITSDEEGEAEFGTKEIVNYLIERGELPHFCVIGEPSASVQTGDVIKVGRRGAISGEILLSGKQGHVAYPKYANNAAHKAAEIVSWLSRLPWDKGSDDFPRTSLQVTGIDTGTWTDNIIPGAARIGFNVRYSHKQTECGIKALIQSGIAKFDLAADIQWLRPCQPYFTNPHTVFGINLISEVEKAIYSSCHLFPRLSTSGGTSDGRFIALSGCQVVELGVPNHSIHQVNEHVEVTDLITLERVYYQLLTQLMR